ncbi:MAG: hypothetical protein AAGN66_22070 [Acidobacteriota bacterium]
MAQTKDTLRQSLDFLRIGNRAVERAQQESREMGIANVYSRRGRVYWELPNGDVTFEDPYRPGGPLARPASTPRA